MLVQYNNSSSILHPKLAKAYERKYEETFLDPIANHRHYSKRVQELTRNFISMDRGYEKTCDKLMRHDGVRYSALQLAWDALVRARKNETGTGFYLPPK
jgi:hypothetical protein